MSDSEIWYSEWWNPAFLVRTYWANTDFPNLVLLGWKERWIDEHDFLEDEFSVFIKDLNAVPDWLQTNSKNKEIVRPELSLASFYGEDAYDNSSSCFENPREKIEKHIFPIDDVMYIFDIDREPKQEEHSECTGESFVYFELKLTCGFEIGVSKTKLDNPNADMYSITGQEFWDAVKKSKEVFYYEGDGTGNEDSTTFAISQCSKCVPFYDLEVNTGDSIRAVEELLSAETLTAEQKALADDVLSNAISELNLENSEEFMAVTRKLISRYPNDFPQVESCL
jgi:hypothetical protein